MNQESPTVPTQATLPARRILLANAKGGCGKSTLATNLASAYARAGKAPALLDYDPQGSSSQWLSCRSKDLPDIIGIKAYKTPDTGVTRDWYMRVPRHVQRIIVDTPAALQGPALQEQLRLADLVIVPVLPSPIDTHAAARFIGQVLLSGNFRNGNKSLLVLANRVRQNTKSLQKLERFLSSLKLPQASQLRDTQNYVFCAELGMGVTDLQATRSEKDQQQWAGLLGYIEQLFAEQKTPSHKSPTAQISEAVYTVL